MPLKLWIHWWSQPIRSAVNSTEPSLQYMRFVWWWAGVFSTWALWGTLSTWASVGGNFRKWVWRSLEYMSLAGGTLYLKLTTVSVWNFTGKNSLTVSSLATSAGHYSSSSYDDSKVYSGIWCYTQVVWPGVRKGVHAELRAHSSLFWRFVFCWRVFPRDLALSNGSAHWRGPFCLLSTGVPAQPHCAWLCMWVLGLNWSLHSCRASAL